MKHAHIGLVALAAMVIAGCGGGSSKTSTNDDMKMEEAKPSTVDLMGVTGFPLGEDGTLTVTLEPGDEELGPQESKIECAAGDDQCVFTVSRNQFGALTATYTGGKVTVTPKVSDDSKDNVGGETAQNNQQQPANNQNNQQQNQQQTQQNQQLQQENRQLRQDNQELTKERDDANQRADSAQDGPRAERLVRVLSAGTIYQTATVEHMRGQGKRRDVGIDGLPPSSKAAPSLTGGWTGIESSELPGGAYGPKGYLYTDRGDPNRGGATREFWKVHGIATLAVDTDTDNTKATLSTAVDGQDNAIKIGAGTTPVALMGTEDDGFERLTGNTKGYTGLRIDANFGGTPGKLICTDGCTGTIDGSDDEEEPEHWFKFDDERKPIFPNSATWKFKADSLIAPHNRADDETYLYFGYWLNTPEEPTGDPEFKVIRGGGDSLTTVGLIGKATYRGPAIGQYAINTSGPTPVKRAGMFTATATLNADFGDATAEGRIVSGSITGFQAGSTSTEGWALPLGRSTEFSDGTEVTGTFGSTSKIGGVTVSGNWGATIYGANNASVATPPARATCPREDCAADVAGFAGWFRASATANAQAIDSTNPAIVSIAGAFAAK